MSCRTRLCIAVVVFASALLWLVLIAGIVVRPVQAFQGAVVSVEVTTTASPQTTPTKGQPTPQGQSTQTEQMPSWVTLVLLLIGCAVLLAFVGFMFWIGGILPWRGRGRPVGWRSEVVVALLTALGLVVASQVFNVFNLPIWARIVLPALAVVLALAGSVMKLRSTQLEKERSWERQVRGLLNLNLGTDRQLLRLSALSPYRLGISPSRYGGEDQRGDDPYVSRVVDKKLDQVLASKRFVLVVGDSKAGKSRTAYEAA